MHFSVSFSIRTELIHPPAYLQPYGKIFLLAWLNWNHIENTRLASGFFVHSNFVEDTFYRDESVNFGENLIKFLTLLKFIKISVIFKTLMKEEKRHLKIIMHSNFANFPDFKRYKVFKIVYVFENSLYCTWFLRHVSCNPEDRLE